jgi:hypothetical protein
MEAEVLFSYLTGKPAQNKHVELHSSGVSVLKLHLSLVEEEIITWLTKYPYCVKIIDLGLGFFMSKSHLRLHFLLASAIIESDSAFLETFLIKKRITFPILKISWIAFKTAWMLPFAFILFKLKRWK